MKESLTELQEKQLFLKKYLTNPVVCGIIKVQ